MAQKYLVQVIDDLDGTELAESDLEQVRFGVDGTAYVIDLSRGNAARLRETLGRYVDAARRDQVAARSSAGGGGAKASGARRTDLDQVRSWANDHGYTVSLRGRVPLDVLAAYDAR